MMMMNISFDYNLILLNIVDYLLKYFLLMLITYVLWYSNELIIDELVIMVRDWVINK
jgi:hypothetical protein